MKEGQKYTNVYAVTANLLKSYTDLSGDRNPIHVDDISAREKGNKMRIVHGNILGMFLSHFVGEFLFLDPVLILEQSIRFKSPVYPGDRLSLEATIEYINRDLGLVQFNFLFSKKNKRSEVIAEGQVTVKTY